MTPKYLCGICAKDVTKSHNAVCCDICNLWVHIKCNNITKFCYRKLQNSQDPWYCKKCIKQILPFSELTESQLNRVTKENIISSPKKIIQENNLIFLNDECGTSINNDYFTPDEFYKEMSTISPTCNLYLHMNISSLPYHFGDLKYLLGNCQSKPKVTGISECRLRTNRTVLSNIDLNGYTYEWTLTEASKGGTLIYIDIN